MALIPLSESALAALKKSLRKDFPEVRSSHLTEAMAVALGFQTHAALLATLQSQAGEPAVELLDDDRFVARLQSLGYQAEGVFSFESLNNCPGLISTDQVQIPPKVPLPAPMGGSVAKAHSVIISGFLSDLRGGKVSVLGHEYLDTKYPGRRYAKCRRIPRHWCATNQQESIVREQIATAVRAIAFMDATDLRPSDAHTRLYGHGKGPAGFDHSCVWIDDHRRYVVTTEPYTRPHELDRAITWCETNGWPHLILPRQIGIWNPCRGTCSSDCTTHTVMLITVPTNNGGDISAVRDALLRSGPFPNELSF